MEKNTIAHEMMAHVPLFVHPNPKKVLVVGDDEGGLTSEVLHHRLDKCIRRKTGEALDLHPTDRFEVIYGDSPDLKPLLTPDGILICRANSPIYAEKEQAALAQNLKSHFKRVYFYNYADITAPGGLSTLAFASDTLHPLDDLSRSKVSASGMEFQYYNLGIHEAAFLLPEFQKRNLANHLNPL